MTDGSQSGSHAQRIEAYSSGLQRLTIPAFRPLADIDGRAASALKAGEPTRYSDTSTRQSIVWRDWCEGHW